ncbi:uncharacterized protein METZ01_LOCUS493201 [marine metagenome]|uniref:Uncharacterized protein n=1 Tax=marine metagenome TaxID=408172 RepID=A0A383D725_9ZZZZ
MRWTDEETQKETSRGFKCPEYGGKLGGLLLVNPADLSDPLHVVESSKCKNWIPAHIFQSC